MILFSIIFTYLLLFSYDNTYAKIDNWSRNDELNFIVRQPDGKVTELEHPFRSFKVGQSSKLSPNCEKQILDSSTRDSRYLTHQIIFNRVGRNEGESELKRIDVSYCPRNLNPMCDYYHINSEITATTPWLIGTIDLMHSYPKLRIDQELKWTTRLLI